MSETPLCQELHASSLDSNDIRAWRSLAYRLEHGLTQAQARCAELEKAVLGECEECGRTIITPLHHLPSVEKDAARYRWLRESGPGVDSYWVAHGIIGCLSHWKAEHLDAAIDDALKSR